MSEKKNVICGAAFWIIVNLILAIKDVGKTYDPKPISFYELDGTGKTTKESKEWFKVEFVEMTEKEYNELPEFTGF